MINQYTRLFLLVLFFVVAALTSCDTTSSDGETSDELQLRVHNATDSDPSEDNVIHGPITVILQPNTDHPDFEGPETVIDFGTIEVGETSEFKTVPNNYFVEVDGERFGGESFSLDSGSSNRWTLNIEYQYDYGNGHGWGWSKESE